MALVSQIRGVLGLALVVILACDIAAAEDMLRFWVGASGGGIYTGLLETRRGELCDVHQVVSGIEAHYIVKHPAAPVIYAAIRTEGPSRIAAYRANSNGKLDQISELDSRPHGVSHVNVSRDGRYLGVAYYRTGIAGVYRLDEEGRIDSVLAEVRHDGKSVNAERQEGPHPHWAGFSPDSRFLYVPDLGTDHIWVYEILEDQDAIRLVQKAASEPGSGPRHMVIHPRLDMVYVSDELAARVSRYALDRRSGKLRHLESMARAPEADGKTRHTVSDIRLHPSGRFLYLINRGFDQVSVFAVDQVTGRLTPVQREPVRGSISRSMAFDSDGQWALVAAHDSSTVALFEVDPYTGKLSYTRQMVAIPTPMAIAMDNIH